ncbi:MAG TPA: TetR/AcrR family transcriptional regulator [Phormidium sp.]
MSKKVSKAAPIEEGASDKREQILQGAMQEFLAQGFTATSMDRVAKTAGVSKATVYSHFEDKEGLFVTLIERLAQRKFQLIMGSLSLSEEPKILLRQLATVLLDQMCNDPEYMIFVRLVIAESGRFPNLAKTFVRNIAKPAVETLTQYLATHPELKISDPEATARIFLGALIHFKLSQEVLHGNEIMPMESDRIIDSLTRLISC